MAPERPGEHVGVIGGGISGLATAHGLSKGGARVTVLESSSELGGLGGVFDVDGVPLERFYHCMLPSDRHLLALLRDIGLDTQVYWKETSFGFMREGRLYGLNTPLELLRFSPLTMLDRVRVGATGAWGSIRSARGLDDITCESWLTALSGRRAFDVFWKPMLEAKFGDRYREVPALWFWTRFNREKGAKKERKGYLSGGYRRITDTLARSLRERGVEIVTGCAVEQLDLDPQGRPFVALRDGATRGFDRVVYAGPVAGLGAILDPVRLGLTVRQIGAGIDMQGVVNAVLLLRRGLTPHYWVATVDPSVPFQGIVETTTLIDTRDTGGLHLVYLMNYLHRSDPLFARDDAAVLADYVGALKRLFPDLRDADIAGRHVFRSPFVEPIYTLGFGARKPDITLLPGRVYLATTAQVYPEVTSWNGSVGLAAQVVERMASERVPAAAAREPAHV